MLSELLIPLILVLLMIIVGTGLSLIQFAEVLRSPASLLGGTALQIVVLPAGGLAIILAFDPPPEIAIGLLLIAACPGGALSNFYCHLFNLNVALSVLLTGLSSIVGFLSLPLILAIALPAIDPAQEIDVPVTGIILRLLLLLLVPVAVGMLLRRWKPQVVEDYSTAMRIGGLFLVGLLLGLIFYTQWDGAVRLFAVGVSLSAVFTVFALASGWVVASLMRETSSNRSVFSVEFAVRNAGVAAVVAASALGRPEFVIFGALFVVVQFPLIMLLLWFNKRIALSGAGFSEGTPGGR